jgi:hypothetical protein
MDPAQALMELEQIRVLKARYFRFVDTKAWAAFAELFEDDATAEFPSDQPGLTLRGREEIAGQIAALLDDVTSLHQGYMPELELTSPTAAKGVWAMEDRLEWPADAPGGARRLHGWGHYHETYRKSAAGWRIASLVLTRLKVVTGPP